MSHAKSLLEDAKNVAFHFLSYRARTCKEMEDKLRARHFSDKVIRKTLGYLKEQGYLDDRAFAVDWVESRSSNQCIGPIRLLRELDSKGIEEGIREGAVESLFQEVEEKALAQAAAEKRMAMIRKAGDIDGPGMRRRLYGYMKRKGFSSETVHSVITGLMLNP